ncbi:MAG: tRNA (guanosine(46)-N7)-methyltransferase TrmB [Pirellulales bacterium]|nr:tRNA (guanosine(46)-N7)-methyltransferase TrmB [Pirellulales bacterium]
MGRRALRKIDPSLDLSRHLLAINQLPKPWNQAVLFGREAPLEMEVGSGKGLFLAEAATLRPECNFLGIEISQRYARYCAARLVKANLQNARMLEADGQRVLAEFLPSESAAAVHVYFPDPWWKERHKKRRVMNTRSVQEIERVLVPGGTLHFWTDVEEYFETTIALIRENTRLEGPLQVAERPASHDLDFRTHFERRTRMHGETVHRAEFRKPWIMANSIC